MVGAISIYPLRSDQFFLAVSGGSVHGPGLAGAASARKDMLYFSGSHPFIFSPLAFGGLNANATLV
jgi:hypothetical protein